MTEEQALRALASLGEPLGPLRTPADAEGSDRAWAAAAGSDAIDAFLDLLARPPSRLAGRSPDSFEYEVSRGLTLLGSIHPQALLDCASERLGDPRLRPTLIEVLGTLPHERSLALLARLAEPGQDLSEEEAVRLACALGEIGGRRARRLLETLRGHPAGSRPRVIAEIEVAISCSERFRGGGARTRRR